MTIGATGDFTWRYRLWQHLGAVCPTPYEIVGPRTTLYDPEANAPLSHAYADPSFPPDARRHLAGWGEGWLHMAPAIADAVREAEADVLLVSLGLIDLGFYTDAEQTAANARTFITAARTANPHIRMVLLPVIPNVRAESDAPFAASCARFNELLAKAVADLDTPSSPLLLASRPRTTTSTRTRTTAPTPARPANTSSPPPSPTRCTRRGGWAGRTPGSRRWSADRSLRRSDPPRHRLPHRAVVGEEHPPRFEVGQPVQPGPVRRKRRRHPVEGGAAG